MLDFILGNQISREVFLKEYFEKKPLLIRRSNRDYYKQILTVDDIDRLLFSMSHYYPDKRIVNNALESPIDFKEYVVSDTKRIDPIKFMSLFSTGSTMVFSRAHEDLDSLGELTNQMSLCFKHPFQTNLYITPNNSQGFSPHYDTHDVFILQFYGSKRWRLYDQPQPLADRTQNFEKETFEIGNVVKEFDLNQGDMLYIPRGVVHDANCVDTNSGHITLGLVGKTWAEQIADLIMNESKNHLALRKHPKFHLYDNAMEVEDVKNVLAQLVTDLFANEDVLDKTYASLRPRKKGGLMSVIQADLINENTLFKINGIEYVRRDISEVIVIKYFDKKITLPLIAVPLVEEIFNSDTDYIEVSVLYSIADEETVIMVLKQLINCGVISIIAGKPTEGPVVYAS